MQIPQTSQRTSTDSNANVNTHVIVDFGRARSPLRVLSCVCLGLLRLRRHAVINTVVIISLLLSLVSGCNSCWPNTNKQVLKELWPKSDPSGI